jgi:hypothetical protein
MTDTSREIAQQQLHIWLSKPVAERFHLAATAMDESIFQARALIRKNNPGISMGDLQAEFIGLHYQDERDADYLKGVMDWIREKYRQPKKAG